VTIQDLGSIGELVAAIATVATLIYLAIQIRANTRGMAAESNRATHSVASSAVIALADNRELAEVFTNGLKDLDALDDIDSTRFSMIVSELVSAGQLMFAESKLGIDSTFLSPIPSNLNFLRAPGGREWWRRNHQHWDSEFGSWLTRALDLDTQGVH
jgi:hypothetical protein